MKTVTNFLKIIFCGLLVISCVACKGNTAVSAQDPYVASSDVTGYEAPVALEETGKIEENDEVPFWYTETAIAETMAEQEGYYHYAQMEEKYHKLYAQILLVLMNFGENMIISTNSEEELTHVFQCVYNDHPEIFWVNGYRYVRRTRGRQELDFGFSGDYIYDAQEVATLKFSVSSYVAHATHGVERASDYEKVKHIYEYIISHTEYELGAKDNQSILSVMIYGKSVCQGYAKAMQYLLNYLDIPATLVLGTNEEGEGHAWNLVMLDGSYYYLDVTWGDASYSGNMMFGTEQPPCNYDYLNITTDELLQNHQIVQTVPLPMCVAVEDNYYRKEGRYYTAYSATQLGNVFEDAYAAGEKIIFLKMADDNTYNQFREELLVNQQIFWFLRNTNTVSYMENPINRTLTFWL